MNLTYNPFLVFVSQVNDIRFMYSYTFTTNNPKGLM